MGCTDGQAISAHCDRDPKLAPPSKLVGFRNCWGCHVPALLTKTSTLPVFVDGRPSVGAPTTNLSPSKATADPKNALAYGLLDFKI